jgi:hypothetical protein
VKLDRNGLEVLDRNECRELLSRQTLGRIGVTVDALPVVVPVNYQLFDGQLIIQTERGTRLAGATEDTIVAFEVDHIDADGVGWSVAITGIANEITSPDVIAQLRVLPFTRWVRHESDRYVGISLDLMAGRRLGRSRPHEKQDKGVVACTGADDERMPDLVVAERRRPRIRAVAGEHDRAHGVEQATGEQ